MGFYSDPSIFSGAHAAVRQTEINKEMGTDAQVGNAVEKNWVGGVVLDRGQRCFRWGAQRPSNC